MAREYFAAVTILLVNQEALVLDPMTITTSPEVTLDQARDQFAQTLSETLDKRGGFRGNGWRVNGADVILALEQIQGFLLRVLDVPVEAQMWPPATIEVAEGQGHWLERDNPPDVLHPNVPVVDAGTGDPQLDEGVADGLDPARDPV